MSQSTDKPKYPKTRWNLHREKWESQASKGAKWAPHSTKNKAKSITSDAFVKKWTTAESVAEVARSLSWTHAKVRGQKTRLNNKMKSHAWYEELSKEDQQGLILQDLPDFTDNQATAAAKHSSESFGSDKEAMMLLFGLTKKKSEEKAES